MCGIAGIIYTDRHCPVELGVLKSMGDRLRIAAGTPKDSGSGLGLAWPIGDSRSSTWEGATSRSAMRTARSRSCSTARSITSRSCCRDLEARGHRFRTKSDTEVLVHLYEEHGVDLVERLRGMFAFALWDPHERRLVLARDRLGLKPLYLYRDAEKLVFGSELKAILACPGVPRAVDPPALEDYLAYGMVPGVRTIFHGIEKLPPAHVLAVCSEI